MDWYFNLRMVSKLVLAFGLIVATTVVLGGFSVNRLALVNAQSVDLEVNWVPSLHAAAKMRAAVIDFRRLEMGHILAPNDAELSRYEQEMDGATREFEAAFQRYVVANANERRLMDQTRALWGRYQEQHRAVREHSRAYRNEQARQLTRGAELQTFQELMTTVREIERLNVEGASAASGRAAGVYGASRSALIGATLAQALGAMLLAWLLARRLAQPLSEAVVVLGAVAEGDFSRGLEARTHDELGQLASALNTAVERVREALLAVRDDSDQVASASQQLRASSEELSASAQEQAANLEQSASSLEQLSATVRQTATDTQQATAASHEARAASERGARVAEGTTRAMKDITASSRKIADIITTIDEFAFQTNLLALNAAVEAARAGEQGRGFAVVAAEVRTLAQQSAGAAREIKALIDASLRDIQRGVELASESGRALQEIDESVRRVTELVTQIAGAAREQSSGIEVVTGSVSTMDRVTQSNASQTEELSSTASALQETAEGLRGVVARFRLDAETRREVSRRAERDERMAPEPRRAHHAPRPTRAYEARAA